MGVSFGVQCPYPVQPQTQAYKTLCLKAESCGISRDWWAVPEPELLAYLEYPGHQTQHMQTTNCAPSREVWPKLVAEKQWKWGL